LITDPALHKFNDGIQYNFLRLAAAPGSWNGEYTDVRRTISVLIMMTIAQLVLQTSARSPLKPVTRLLAWGSFIEFGSSAMRSCIDQ